MTPGSTNPPPGAHGSGGPPPPHGGGAAPGGTTPPGGGGAQTAPPRQSSRLRRPPPSSGGGVWKALIALAVVAMFWFGPDAFEQWGPQKKAESFNPAAEAPGRFQIAQAKTHGGCVVLSQHISVCRDADGTEEVVVKNTTAVSAETAEDSSMVTARDIAITESGVWDLSAAGLQGPLQSVGVETGGTVKMNTWVKDPVFMVSAGNGVLTVTFPSAAAQELGAGQKTAVVQQAAAQTNATPAAPKITVPGEELAAVIVQEAGIASAWGQMLKGEALQKRVETFEALAAVQTAASPNFFAADGSAAGLYGMTQTQLQEGLDSGKITYPNGATELLQAIRNHPATANAVAVAYWVMLDSQTFPSSPAHQLRFNASKEAWCVIGMARGVAEMRARITAPDAEDPTTDPLLQKMQPWYASLEVYHQSHPVATP